jgi:hypothetical protein
VKERDMEKTKDPDKVCIRRQPVEDLITEIKRKIRTNGGAEKNASLVTYLTAVVRELSEADLRSELGTALPIPVSEEEV